MTASTLAQGAPGSARRSGGFSPNHPWDRNFFLVYAALIWLGILSGFGPEVAKHIQTHAKPYPPIVHLHAAVFMGWLVLFSGQVLLIRARRLDLHRTLGWVMLGVAAAMAVLGPATALVADHGKIGTPDADPAFLAIQFTDIAAFVGLLGAAVLLRDRAAAHKRLTLLATIYISDAGFARWLGDGLHGLFGDGAGSYWASAYLGTAVLMLGIGVYDLATRRRLHPAWLAGLAWAAAMEATALTLYFSPAWKPVAARLIAMA
jgi:uncharacterized membrane protein